MYDIFGLKLAPLNLPIERRLQTLAVLLYVLEFIYMPGIYLMLGTMMLFSPFWLIASTYLFFYFRDRGQERRGGRRSEWLRNLPIWKYLVDYFPAKLIKTADLPAEHNYIFGLHPHGIMCYNTINSFGHDGNGFSEKFPGLTPHLLTLDQQFRLPIHRDLVMFMGGCSCSRESMNYLLKSKSQGNVLCLVPGGAAEALNAEKMTMVLTLKKRKGFIRVALENGASLVPVLQFGENNLFNLKRTAKGSFIRKIQDKFYATTGVSLPIFIGRGIFQYTFGILPFRHPLYTVVGKPIHVEKVADPSQEQVDKLHELYCENLSALYKEQNPVYGDPKIELVIE